MRRQKLLPSFLLCLPFAFASCGGGQSNANGSAAATPAPAPSATAQATPAREPQVVTTKADEVRLTAGGAGEASVRLDIAPGYHTHANPAADKFYIPTSLSAEPVDGITPGKPVYPPGKSVKLGFFDKPLSLYEGNVLIRLPLRADKNALKGRHTLNARVRVQHCNDKECFNPRYIDTPINVTID
ncbi:MAG TPA: protein-disulfide reductase DsbD N-terminal domain-containing protein [Pyrinomonadaceae bacterium]